MDVDQYVYIIKLLYQGEIVHLRICYIDCIGVNGEANGS